MTPRFAIVIPAWNEASNLPRLFASLRAAGAFDRAEIILVDNMSTDDTRALAREAGARVVAMEEKVRISALRNIGAGDTQAEIVVFLDADMEVPPDWLDRLDAAFAEPGVDVVGFVEDIPEAAPWYAEIWSRRTLARRDRRRRTDFLPGRNIAVRRRFFEETGGFDQDLTTSEDKDFTMRLAKAGAGVWSLPPIGLFHWGYERSFGEWVRKEFWRQRSHLTMIGRLGLSVRRLRFPVLSILHLLFAAALMLGIIAQGPVWLVGIFLLLVPSFLLTVAKVESRRSFRDVIAFTALYALRFLIAGAAVLTEAVDLVRIRLKRMVELGGIEPPTS